MRFIRYGMQVSNSRTDNLKPICLVNFKFGGIKIQVGLNFFWPVYISLTVHTQCNVNSNDAKVYPPIRQKIRHKELFSKPDEDSLMIPEAHGPQCSPE